MASTCNLVGFIYFTMRYGIYLNLTLIKLAIIAVRYVVFLFFYPAGINVWICPFLFDDKRGFFDSFVPLLQVRKREDMGIWVAIRFLSMAAIVSCCVYLYLNPELVTGNY